MESTNFSVGSGNPTKMIMRSGCDTGYFERDGDIYKGGSSTDLSIGYDGRIKKGGSDTGYVVGSGGQIMKDSDKGYSLDWLFS
jgi:hypothetical protein